LSCFACASSAPANAFAKIAALSQYALQMKRSHRVLAPSHLDESVDHSFAPPVGARGDPPPISRTGARMERHAKYLHQLHASWNDDRPTGPSRATAKMGFLDLLGCAVAGSVTEPATIVRDLVQGSRGNGEAALFGTDLRSSAAYAALANGTAGHVLDYDDMNAVLTGHPSVVLVPVVMGLGETRRSSGKAVLAAYILGFEVSTYFGRLMNPRHYQAGWHATSSLGVLGGAAAAAHLLQLDGDRMLEALAIAASSAKGLRANFGSMTKSLHAGQAAESGIRAALLASRGFTGNTTLFDAEDGFMSMFGMAAEPVDAKAENELEIDASGIGIKPYACCGAGVSLIDAMIAIQQRYAPSPKEVIGIDCRVSEMVAQIMPLHHANDGLQAKYCLSYCASIALIDGKGGLDQFSDERAAQADVQDLMKRTKVEAASRLSSQGGRFEAEATVTLADGRTLSETVSIPLGHPLKPLSREHLFAKFHECTDPVLGDEKSRQIIAAVDNLEEVADVREIATLLQA
jgi:2-methylcitrate dehydratase PrpD